MDATIDQDNNNQGKKGKELFGYGRRKTGSSGFIPYAMAFKRWEEIGHDEGWFPCSHAR
jgi:hypothetical protein